MTGLVSVGLVQAVLVLGVGGQGIPPGTPPLPEDAALASLAPPQCMAYVAWAGVAVPDPKSGNHTEQLIAEPAVQKLIAAIGQMIRKGVRSATAKKDQQASPKPEEILDLVATMFSRPGAAFLSKLDFLLSIF